MNFRHQVHCLKRQKFVEDRLDDRRKPEFGRGIGAHSLRVTDPAHPPLSENAMPEGGRKAEKAARRTNGIESVSEGLEPDMRRMIHDMARDIDDRLLRARFRDEKAGTAELIGILGVIPATERFEFVKKAFELSLHSEANCKTLLAYVHEMIHFLEPRESAEIIKFLLEAPKTKTQTALIKVVLDASKTIDDMNEVIEEVGIRRLLGLRDKAVKESVALAVLVKEVRDIDLPNRLEWQGLKQKNSRAASTALDVLEERLKTCLEICRGHPELRGTDAMNQYREIARFNLEYLHRAEKNAENVKEKRTLYNFMLRKMDIEFDYCVRITHEQRSRERSDGSTVTQSVRKWSEGNLRDIRSALEAYLERESIIARPVREIRRVPGMKGEGENLAYQHGGLVTVGDFAAEKPKKNEDDHERLTHLVRHEIAHGLIQPHGLDIWYDEHTGELYPETGAPRFEIDKWAKLAKWRIYVDKFEVFDADRMVRLIEVSPNEKAAPLPQILEIRLNHARMLNGEPVEFSYEKAGRDKYLFMHDPFAKFPPYNYSEGTPFEHLCEAIAYYTGHRDKRDKSERGLLILHAPETFRFLETRLRYYHDDQETLQQLEKALAAEHQQKRHSK